MPVLGTDWFWTTRGDCVEIRDMKAAQSALNNGFIRLTEEERNRFKPGSYHPAHDLGDGSKVDVAPPQKDPPKPTHISDFDRDLIRI